MAVTISADQQEYAVTKAYAFAGTTMTVLVSGEETDRAFAVLHVIKPAGSSTPPHSHDEETELSFVLSGSLGVETEGRTNIVASGGLVVLPASRPHRLFNDSGAPVREFLLCAPAKFDRFVAAAGTPVDPYAEPSLMTDEDRRRLAACAPDFGIRLLPSASPPDGPLETAAFSVESWDVPGARIGMLASLGDGDDDLVLLRATLAPGCQIPLHSHAGSACVFLISGELDVYREGPAAAWQALGPEQAIHVGPNARHAVHNRSDLSADLLAIASMRLARFFAAIGSAPMGPSARLPTPEELAAFKDAQSLSSLARPKTCEVSERAARNDPANAT